VRTIDECVFILALIDADDLLMRQTRSSWSMNDFRIVSYSLYVVSYVADPYKTFYKSMKTSGGQKVKFRIWPNWTNGA